MRWRPDAFSDGFSSTGGVGFGIGLFRPSDAYGGLPAATGLCTLNRHASRPNSRPRARHRLRFHATGVPRQASILILVLLLLVALAGLAPASHRLQHVRRLRRRARVREASNFPSPSPSSIGTQPIDRLAPHLPVGPRLVPSSLTASRPNRVA
jgi:hypothetical protein